MGKVLAAVVSLLVLCIGALALVAALEHEPESVAVDNLLAEDLTRRIQTAEARGEDVDLAEATDFAWDRVLIVDKGTPAARISQALGSEFGGELNYTAETERLFVFARGDELARYADYRGRAAFEGFEEPVHELAREDAVLRVRDLVVSPG